MPKNRLTSSCVVGPNTGSVGFFVVFFLDDTEGFFAEITGGASCSNGGGEV